LDALAWGLLLTSAGLLVLVFWAGTLPAAVALVTWATYSSCTRR
jgi:hypothetical protein